MMSARYAALLVALAMLVSACTAGAGADPSASRAPVTAADNASDSAPGAIERGEVPDGAAYIARPTDLTAVLDEPGGGQIALLEPTTQHGSPTAVAVVGQPDRRDDWIEIRLNQRPNGMTGWVWADDVELTWTTLRIEVDLTERELRLFDGDEMVVRGAAAIGRPDTPTPTGETYVSDRVATPDPTTLYGPFALGLAMYSDVVTEYAGGNGQVAIHGTNAPALLGRAVSHGCARVHNDVIELLAGKVPLGTPVVIF